jgi:hypothetical protein
MSRKRIMIEEYASWQKPIISIANEGVATKGNRYIVGAAPTGTFNGMTPNDIAWYDGDAWQTDTPSEGWRLYNNATGKFMTYVAGETNAWVADEDVEDKMDKVPEADEDNLASFDNAGNVKDSGVSTPVFDGDLGCILIEFSEPS